MKASIITLTGVITDPMLAIDRILAYYFRTTKTDLGILNSRRSFITDSTDRENSVTNITNSLNYILDKYFYSFSVTVEDESSRGEPIRDISISISLRANAKDYYVGRIGQIEGNKLSKIITVDNLGGI